MGEAQNPRPKDKGTAKGIGSYQWYVNIPEKKMFLLVLGNTGK